MSEQRPEDQHLTDGQDDTALEELNDAGAGAGADPQGNTFEPEEDA